MQESNSYKNIIFYILVLLFFILPLAYHPSFFDPALAVKSFIFGLFVTFMVVIWGLYFIRDIEITFIKSKLSVIIFIFLFINALSVVWAYNKYESVVWAIRLLFFVLFYIILIHTLNKRNLIYCMHALIVSIGICSLIGILQASGFKLNFFTSLTEVSSTFGNRNIAASVLILVIPLSLFLFLHETKLMKEIGLGLIVSLQIGYLINTRTRSAWVSMCFCLILSIVSMVIFKSKIKVYLGYLKDNIFKRKKILLISIMLILICFISTRNSGTSEFTYGKDKQSLTSTLSSISKIKDYSVNKRITLFKNTLNIIKDNPFLGVGVGNWRLHYYKYAKTDNNLEKVYARPHNDYLWIFSETGLFGIIIYGFMIGVLFYMCIISLIKAENPDDKYIIIGITVGILSFFIDSLANFSRERITPIMILWFFMASVVIFNRDNKSWIKINISSDKKYKSLFISCITFILCLTLFSTFILWKFLRFDHQYKEIAQELNSGNWNKVISEINVKDSYTNFYSNIFLARGITCYNLNDFSESIKSYHRFLSLNPYHFYALYNLGLVYEKSEDMKNAIKYLEKSIEIKPDFETALMKLGELYFEAGFTEKAQKTYTQVLQYNKKSHEAYNNLGVLLMENGQYEAAQSKFLKALSLKNKYIDAHLNAGINNYYNLQDYHNTIFHLKKVLELQPSISIKKDLEIIILDANNKIAKQTK